jgi:hypothetical protein
MTLARSESSLLFCGQRFKTLFLVIDGQRLYF